MSHVARYAVQGLERALEQIGVRGHEVGLTPLGIRVVWKLAAFHLIRPLPWRRARAIIVPLMGLEEARLFPWVYLNQLIPFVFDCLPKEFGLWAALLRRHKMRIAVFSSRSAASEMGGRVKDCRCLWIPEGLEFSEYPPPKPLSDRSIDVLEFGRKYQKYHDQIVLPLKGHGFSHFYEKNSGDLVFPDRESFIRGLTNARISICFPSSVTHPERFGDLETVTQRYFESMAAGAVLVGKAPAELVELCGYDPVVAVDWTDPAGQLAGILESLHQYEGLQRRNAATVRERCGWAARVDQMIKELARFEVVVQ